MTPKLTERERQLLWVLGDRKRGLEPGTFYRKLFEAALEADDQNLMRIGLGFADVAYAVLDWRHSPDGWKDRE